MIRTRSSIPLLFAVPVLLSVLVASLPLAGCGGKSSGDGGPSLPADFARVFPVPPGARVTRLTGAPVAKTFEADFEASEDADAVRDFYTGALARDGWSLNASTVAQGAWMDNGSVYSATASGNGYFVTVTVDQGSGPATFKVVVGPGRR